MHHRVTRLHGFFFKLRTFFSEELIALLLVVFVFVSPAGASTRFENRSLFMNSVEPGATTSYKISLDYMTPAAVGSLDLRFCMSPIPYDPCVKPDGLDISQANLGLQTGEVGFSSNVVSDTRIILSRTPAMISAPGVSSTYTFNSIKNPANLPQSFSIRLASYSSANATGSQIDFGSVKGDVSGGVTLQTQVPPMLIFCAAEEVDENCLFTNESYYSDLGTLNKDSTLTAQSQFAVGTNATAGFAVTASGGSMAAGTNVIDGMQSPLQSRVGSNQFGINLVENSELNIGHDPEGIWANAQPTPDYAQSNRFKYVSGDVIASSPNVSLIKKFTVSYIINASPNLRAGVYATSINYVASGRF